MDGYAYRLVSHNATWADIHDGIGTLANDSNSNNLAVHIFSDSIAQKWRQIIRAIMLFNTAAIPAGSQVQSATLHLTGYMKINQFSWSPALNVYGSTPASNNALVASDYGQCQAVPFSDSPIGYAAFNAAGMNVLTLNAAGLAAIIPGGITKLSVRESNHDAPNIAPTWETSHTTYMRWYLVEQPDPAARPYLEVTWRPPL